MHVIAKRLREHGRRKHEQAIQSDHGTAGDFTLASVAGVVQAKLSGDDGSRQEPIIPLLYHAELVTVQSDKMLLRGVERAADGAEWVQEWSVRVVAK